MRGKVVMTTLKKQVADLLAHSPGLTDREITDRLRGRAARQQPINAVCRELADGRTLDRRRRDDGLIGNFPTGVSVVARSKSAPSCSSVVDTHTTTAADMLGEDEVKKALVQWLARNGWTSKVAWGRQQGIDIEATRGGERWIIEVKGCGSRDAMRINYFLAILGETLQRMDNESASYSIALPNMGQYRRLWSRLPALAKSRTRISALFVEDANTIHHLPT